MDSMLPIAIVSVIIGTVIAFLVFGNYFQKRKSEVESITQPETIQKASKPQQSQKNTLKKSQAKSHSHTADHKDANKRHHPLDLNTLKGHGDIVTGVCFSPNAQSLATACGDGVVRVFKLDDASSKSFKFLRINLPAGGHPTAVAFADEASSVVVACDAFSGSSLYMYGEEKTAATDSKQAKLPLPEIKWEQHKVHDKRAILTLVGTKATYGSADGSTIIVSCSEDIMQQNPAEVSYFAWAMDFWIKSVRVLTGVRLSCLTVPTSKEVRTDIVLFHGKSGKIVGNVDTNQLKNNMAAISPNGRFIAAAAFTADVKVWEIVYSKDGAVKEVSRVMELKGHKSAVTCLCFAPNSEQIITASKDGSIRVWNINVRYHLSEDPKTLRVLPIPLKDANGTTLHYDRLCLSPDGKILATTHGSMMQWLCPETGKVLDTAEKAHDGDITDMAWSPSPIPMGHKRVLVLATASVDKKVKLWAPPALNAS